MPKRPPKLSQQILDEASSWFIDFHEGEPDATTRADFDAWLRTSPEHVRAYLQMSAFWEDAGILAKRKVDTQDLIARANAEDNVVPLELGGGPRNAAEAVPSTVVADVATELAYSHSFENRSRAAKRKLWALAASFLLAVAAGLGAWQYNQRNVYTAAIGEQRSITLEDGSAVELDSLSRLRVSFSEQERTVELVEGRALFKVAKDAARPFVVRSGATSVRAVGTQFDVYRKQSGTVVTVIEGKVAVSSVATAADVGTQSGTERREGKTGTLFLTAGEQLTVARASAKALPSEPEPRTVDIGAATAWQRGQVAFDYTALADAVAEMNRYSKTRLVIEDPSTAAIRVNGIFRAGDQENFAQAVAMTYQLEMRNEGHTIILGGRIAR